MPAVVPPAPTCEGCLFYRATTDPWGKCVRHPPSLSATSS